MSSGRWASRRLRADPSGMNRIVSRAVAAAGCQRVQCRGLSSSTASPRSSPRVAERRGGREAAEEHQSRAWADRTGLWSSRSTGKRIAYWLRPRLAQSVPQECAIIVGWGGLAGLAGCARALSLSPHRLRIGRRQSFRWWLTRPPLHLDFLGRTAKAGIPYDRGQPGGLTAILCSCNAGLSALGLARRAKLHFFRRGEGAIT